MTFNVTLRDQVSVNSHNTKTSRVTFSMKANFEKEYLWKSMYLRFPGSLKLSSNICYVLFSSEEKFGGGPLLLFLNLTSYTNLYYTVNFKPRVLSVFPSSSGASTHFHFETPNISVNC